MHDKTILTYKKLHFIWLGSPMPEHLSANILEWRRLHPDWQTYIWTEKNLPILRNSDLYQRAPELVPRDALYQFRADIARYELLYDFGGFYADVDTRPLQPIDSYVEGREVFAAMEDRNWVGNTYLGSVPGHPLFGALISGLPNNVKRLQGKRPNHLSGPRYLTPLWKANGGYTAPSHLFYPYSYLDIKNGTVPTDYHKDVVCVHEWYHTQTVLNNRKARRL
jgi:mannosyltransferase OCH1-like enzyme